MHKRLAKFVVTAALVGCAALPMVHRPMYAQDNPADSVLRDAGPREPTPREGPGFGGYGILGLLVLGGAALGLPAVLIIRRWDWQQRGALEGADQPPTADPPEWTESPSARTDRSLPGHRPAER